MALQSSGQITLNDIRIELGLSQSNVSLGSMSDTAGKSAPDQASDFYGYSASVTWTAFTTTSSPNSFACFLSATATKYTDRSSGAMEVGDKVRNNSAGTTTPTNGKYKHDNNDVSYDLSSGTVTNITNC